jgi:GH43 family beta-xylosidase
LELGDFEISQFQNSKIKTTNMSPYLPKLTNALLCLLLCLCAQAQTFRNPIRDAAPDPTMTYYNGYYYLTYTNGSQLDMVKAASVAELRTAPVVTVWTDNNPSRCCHMWAPALRLLNGPNGLRWYLYYCADDGNDVTHRNYVLESSGLDPMGPYTFKNKLIPTSGDEKGIDGNVLVKDDGSMYFIWCFNSRIAIATMSNPWTVTSNKVIISVPTLAWERQMAAVNENPAIIKRNGKTFLTYSASHCASPGYAMGMLTNSDGNYMNAASWVKSSTPVFQSSAANGVYGTGGNDFFKSPDGTEDWFVYHATSNPNGDCGNGRSSRIQKVTWNANGTPNFGVPVSTATDVRMPSAGIIVPDGTYRITNVGSGKVLDATGCLGDNGVSMNQWDWWGGDCQRWVFQHMGDGWYKITCRLGGRALDNASCLAADGNKIQLWDWLNNDCQRWKIEDWGGGQMRLVNKASGKLLDVNNGSTANGAQVWQWSANGTNAQRWTLTRVSPNYIANGTYRIRLARNNKVMEPSGGNDTRGTAMGQWDWVDSSYQRWVVEATADGWYKFTSPNGFALDLEVCNNLDGGKVMLWDWLDNDCQRWGFEAIGNGQYGIISKASGKALDAPDPDNGGRVYQWQWLNNGNQHWFVEAPPAPSGARTTTTVSRLSIMPNPITAGHQLQMIYRSDGTQPATITVYDMFGRIVQQQKVTVQNGYNRFVLQTETLRRGVYSTTIQLSNNKKESRKIVIR